MLVEVVHTEGRTRFFSVGTRESGFPKMTELRVDESAGVLARMQNGEGQMINEQLRNIYEFNEVGALGDFRIKQ